MPSLAADSKNQFESQSWFWWISKSSRPFSFPTISVMLELSDSSVVSHSTWKRFWLVGQYRSKLAGSHFCFASWWSWWSHLEYIQSDFHRPEQEHSSFSRYQAIGDLAINHFLIFSRKIAFLERPWLSQPLDHWLSIGSMDYQRYRTTKDESSCFNFHLEAACLRGYTPCSWLLSFWEISDLPSYLFGKQDLERSKDFISFV